jgi:hypothetical protein
MCERVGGYRRRTLTIHNTHATVMRNRIKLDYGRKMEIGREIFPATKVERDLITRLQA